MLELSVKSDIKDLRKKLGRVPEQIIVKSANRALNKAGSKAQSDAIRRISKDTGITPQKVVRPYVTLEKSNFHTLRVRVKAKPKSINLIEFVTKSKRHPGSFKKLRGVEAKAWGKKKVYKHTFVVVGTNSGKPVVVSRKPGVKRVKGKWPRGWSKTIYGPNIRSTFIQREFSRSLLLLGRQIFIKEFERDIRYRLNNL